MLLNNSFEETSKRVPLDIVSAFLLLTCSILGRTWRFSISGTKEIDPFKCRDKGVIFCFWHSNILPLTYIFRGIGVYAVVSSSKDGDRATAIAQRLGHGVIRGSSTRGGVAVIRQCIKVLENGKNVVLIPDGPRGPRQEVKPGIAFIALKTNAPVYPVIANTKNAWRLNSWDKFIIPKPFSHINIIIKEPIKINKKEDERIQIQQFSHELKKSLSL
jgi:lysophospholipid acyltransferase (LPLAT)-like uncharacterized protein